MVQSNPPLFVQDGEYPAKLDRNLIGGFLQPSGKTDTPLVPRAGVRAHGVDSFGETSLRVEISGSQAVVLPGSAFVQGPDVEGISAAYLITNPTATTVTLPSVIAGATQEGMVGIEIIDPADAPSGGTGEGKWELVYKATIPNIDLVPQIWLQLATVTIPDDTAKPIPKPADNRVYTTALGGTVQVNSLDTLNSKWSNAPYGSQAYAVNEDTLYMKNKNNQWGRLPAVAQISGTASNGGIPGHQGELLWNTVNQTLSIYHSSAWVDIASVPAVVRKGEETQYQDKKPNEKYIFIPKLQLKVPAGYSWLSIGHSSVTNRDPAMEKLPENAMLMKVYSPSPRGLCTANVAATVQAFTKNANGGFDEYLTNQFWLNLDVWTSTGVTFDAEGRPEGYQQMYSVVEGEGETWTNQPIHKNFYKPMNNLAQGTTTIRLVFKAAKAGYFDITDLGFRVNTAWMKDLAE